MVERMKKITNPLTIVGIFAALSEVAGTVTIGLLAADTQHVFLWFMIGFPSALVALFFLTLNFNPRVLYSPSDYADEANFMKAIAVRTKIADQTKGIQDSIASLKQEIVAITQTKTAAQKPAATTKAQESIISKLDGLSGSVGSVINTAMDYSLQSIENRLPRSSTQARVFAFLLNKGPVPFDGIVAGTKLPKSNVGYALVKMTKKGIVKETKHDGTKLYSIEPETP